MAGYHSYEQRDLAPETVTSVKILKDRTQGTCIRKSPRLPRQQLHPLRVSQPIDIRQQPGRSSR